MPSKRKTFSRRTKPTLPDGAEIPPHFFMKEVDRRDTPVKVRGCDHEGCGEKADFRAPKSRHNLEEYFWFCLEHVKAYNAAWDYYKGMNTDQIENAVRFQTVWERPTWPFGQMVHGLRKRANAFRESFMAGAEEEEGMNDAEAMHAASEKHADPRFKAQLEALRELGLAPPVDFPAIKQRYRALVKRHHPDVKEMVEGDPAADAQEKIKRLNAAFTLLKQFFGIDKKE